MAVQCCGTGGQLTVALWCFLTFIGLSTKVKKTAGQPSGHERPSSQYATVWMGAESGVYVSFSVLFIFYMYMHL